MPNSDIREAEDLPARRALSEETVLSLVEPQQLGKPHKVLLNHSIIKRYPPLKTGKKESESRSDATSML